MPDLFYSRKYKQVTVEEMGFTFYTDNKGEVKTYNAFSPSIVHTPFDQSKCLEKILKTSEGERLDLQIPTGLQSIQKIKFVKMTFPILIGLFERKGKAFKEIIDGFHSLGESEHLETIKNSISSTDLLSGTLFISIRIRSQSVSVGMRNSVGGVTRFSSVFTFLSSFNFLLAFVASLKF